MLTREIQHHSSIRIAHIPFIICHGQTQKLLLCLWTIVTTFTLGIVWSLLMVMTLLFSDPKVVD